MFQSFAATTSPKTGAERVARLRQAMADAGVDAFLIPRADAHRGETVAASQERLAWLTGFTGSAGFAAVTAARAVLFVDGRYTLQAGEQTDGTVFERRALPKEKLEAWVIEALPEGGKVGFDPWLHTQSEVEALRMGFAGHTLDLVAVGNLVDEIWSDRPAPPAAPMTPHPIRYAGTPHGEKRAAAAAEIQKAGAGATVLSLPDSIAWLLNIRGRDIPRTPVPLAFAILKTDASVALFTDATDPNGGLAEHFGPNVTRAPRADFPAALDALSGPVALDRASVPAAVVARLEAAGAEIIWQRDPCILPKAQKTDAEISGIRAAHLRDGAAVVAFLAWLDSQEPGDGLTEIDIVTTLEGKRRATNALQDIAFETIAGAGPNGAIVHYRVTEATNRALEPGSLLLVDSGGQYLDGTTDITRTVAIGPPLDAAKRPFTLVLKGMIAVSRARFPEGTTGRDLDTLARLALWQAGLDYDHGTGHGVGAFLGVHEGPQSLSRRGAAALRPGMVVSNEPGYYCEGAFGIRIENLLAVNPPATPEGGDRPMLGFETLSLAPIDRRLIDTARLAPDEIAWLDAYHARVLAEIGPLVGAAEAAWLAEATRPLA